MISVHHFSMSVSEERRVQVKVVRSGGHVKKHSDRSTGIGHSARFEGNGLNAH